MSLLCRRFLPLFLALPILVFARGLPAAGEATVMRFVELRDGSVLRLPIVDEERKVSVLLANGTVQERTIRLSALQRLTLTPERVFPRKRAVLALVQKMGSDEFTDREQAHEQLQKMGPAIRSDLETALDLFADFEIQDRLKRILAKWPADPKAVKGDALFDTLEVKGALGGDAGEDGIPVQVDGQVRRLSRAVVAGLSVQPPEFAGLDGQRPVPGGFQRIKENEFPRGCLEEPFETAPDGRRLVIGENIEKLFIRKGFTLSTSIKTSFVSVNNYTVQGKSRGLSAATHQPLFEGEITIRFCRPGRENIPAGVTHFGCWIAAVVPKGTYLIGYDIRGKEVGRINTEAGPNEFLGMRSSVPMHTIKVFPDVNIDRDYTLDDFIYTPPVDAELAHPDRFRTQFRDGERVVCGDISLGPDGIELHGIGGGLPDRKRPLADLVRLTTPGKGKQDRPQVAGIFADLKDGSVVFGARPAANGPAFARRPGLLKQPDAINELWNAEAVRLVLPAKVEPPMMWDGKKRAWEHAIDAKLSEDDVQWKRTIGGDPLRASYFTIGQLVLRKPADPLPGSWHVRTVQGDDIVLSAAEPPALSGRLSKELTTVWEKAPLKIAGQDLVAIYRVPR
jgi:hypothetical protein